MKTITNLIPLLLLFCCICSDAQPSFIVREKDGQLNVQKQGNIRFFVDSSGGRLPVEVIAKSKQIYFKSLKDNIYVLHYNKAAHWFSFDIINTSAKDAPLMIELGDPYIDKITLYKDVNGSLSIIDTAGAIGNFQSRPIINKNFVFQIIAPANSSTSYLLKVKNVYHHVLMRIDVLGVKEYESASLKAYLIWGILSGILLFVIVFSLLIYLVEHSKLYFFFALYVVTALVWVWSNSGLGYQFIWSNYPQIMIRVRFMSAVITIALLVQTMQSFIGQTKHNSRFCQTLNITKLLLILLAAILLLPYTFNDNEILISAFIITGDIVIIVAIIMILASLIEKMRQGFTLALYYLSSTIILMGGAVTLVLARFGILSPTFITLNGNYIGILIQIIILSIGHTQRYQLYRKEKEKALVHMIQQEQESILKVAFARENERKRIAADMHDELGAGLSGLRLIGELTSRKQSISEIKYDIQRFTDLAKDLGEKVKDIVWTFNAENDTLINFIYYIHKYGQNLFEDTDTKFDMGIPSSIPDVMLLGEKRRHLLLIVKEALNNIIKHARATTVLLAITFNDQQVNIRIKDNGQGITNDNNSNGNGLKNMKKRVEEINGWMTIENDKGTCINFMFPVS